MKWRIKHVFNFPPDKPWEQGYVHFGFHGQSGAQYLLHYTEHWLGRLTPRDEWLWTAGAVDRGLSRVHIPLAIKHPHYLTELPGGSLLVSSNGTNEIFRIWPKQGVAELFADTGRLGDAGLPGVVGWARAGEPDADDERMVELLEPYRGHRWRVVRLLYTGGVAPPRRRPPPPPVRLRGW